MLHLVDECQPLNVAYMLIWHIPTKFYGQLL